MTDASDDVAPVRPDEEHSGDAELVSPMPGSVVAVGTESGSAVSAGTVVVHLLAEKATVEGTGDNPGYLPGFGILPADSVREMAATATIKRDTAAATGAGVRVGGAGGVSRARSICERSVASSA